MADTDRIREALAEVYTDQGVEVWMRAPHKQWGGLTVDEMIAAERTDEVLAVIDRLASGVFS